MQLLHQVFIHNPHSRSLNPDGRWVMGASATDINFLNINQTVNALTTGKLKPFNSENNKNNVDNDVLVIGTPTSIMVYDVFQNSDLFYREVHKYYYYYFFTHVSLMFILENANSCWLSPNVLSIRHVEKLSVKANQGV